MTSWVNIINSYKTNKILHWYLQVQFLFVNVTHLNTIPLGRWSAPYNQHTTLLLGLHLHKQTHLSDYIFREKKKTNSPLHMLLTSGFFVSWIKIYQKHTFCKKPHTWKMFPVWDADWPEMVWASIAIGFGHISPGYALRRSANSS